MSNTRPGLNFIGTAPISVAIADNPGLAATDITISTSSTAAAVLNAVWAGVMPTVTGAGLEISIPKVSGASMTFDLQVMFSRLSVLPISSTQFRIEKSSGGGAFSPTTVDSLTHTTSDYEKTKTLTGTLSSGDLLRLYVVSVGGSGGSYSVMIEGTEH